MRSPIYATLQYQVYPDAGCSGYFAQHRVDTLIPTMNPVQFFAHRFPGKTEQEYRQQLGNFEITGMTGLQPIGALSGGQKSRVAFSLLSLQRPHILLLDEVRANGILGSGAVDRPLPSSC
jgi:ATPase subunit of ABC transporter with duplicated ATPase domains